ncbi:hypothetical protein DRO34_02420 [Candidatus Bathyarchaeota archaeon]|nr:MAG: hypothetical protein DRO34_02420 [Candidatus Bathyarchaeota archaeon]
MKDKKSFDETIDKAVKHYSSLFTLPSLKTMLLLLAALCLFSGTLSVFLLDLSARNLALGVAFGAALLVCTLVSDIITNKLFLTFDAVYKVRRCFGLSIFSFALWLPFMLLGNALAFAFHSTLVWLKLWLFGFSAVTILRLTVLNTTSIASSWKRTAAAFLSPSVALLLLLSVWIVMGNSLVPGIAAYLMLSIPISIAAVYAFTEPINKLALKKLGIPSFTLFKAFIVNWIENINTPLERLFEQLGVEKDVEVSIIKFETESATKALLIIPHVHPGPFRNVGSSLLPSMLQEALERKFGCVAAVPHGLLGHELDVASQKHVKRIISTVVNASLSLKASASLASPLFQARREDATVSSQVFGDCALLSLSLAPKTTEDLPQELGEFALNEARKRGLSYAMVINAHNSLNGAVPFNKAVEELQKAITESLRHVSTLEKLPVRVGAAKTVPKEFGLKEGMGPGGITAITVKVGDKTFAYITIDGNNMVPELREKILSTIKALGIDLGEVFTTDTHAVTALVLTRRGYYALGEAIPHDRLVEYVRKTVEAALSNMEPVKVGYTVEMVHRVKVIGEKKIIELCSLVDPAIEKAKHIAALIFSLTGLVLALLVFWLF